MTPEAALHVTRRKVIVSRVNERAGTKTKRLPGAKEGQGGAVQKYRDMTGRPYGIKTYRNLRARKK